MFFEIWGLSLLTIITFTYLLHVSLELINIQEANKTEMSEAVKRMYI